MTLFSRAGLRLQARFHLATRQWEKYEENVVSIATDILSEKIHSYGMQTIADILKGKTIGSSTFEVDLISNYGLLSHKGIKYPSENLNKLVEKASPELLKVFKEYNLNADLKVENGYRINSWGNVRPAHLVLTVAG